MSNDLELLKKEYTKKVENNIKTEINKLVRGCKLIFSIGADDRVFITNDFESEVFDICKENNIKISEGMKGKIYFIKGDRK